MGGRRPAGPRPRKPPQCLSHAAPTGPPPNCHRWAGRVRLNTGGQCRGHSGDFPPSPSEVLIPGKAARTGQLKQNPTPKYWPIFSSRRNTDPFLARQKKMFVSPPRGDCHSNQIVTGGLNQLSCRKKFSVFRKSMPYCKVVDGTPTKIRPRS